MIVEKEYRAISGWVVLVLFFAIKFFEIFTLIILAKEAPPLFVLAAIILGILNILVLIGFQAVTPNEARVLVLFGNYKGTIKKDGFYWVNPFFSKRKISLRVRNFETGQQTTPEVRSPEGKVIQGPKTSKRPIKVNERDGNPIEVSAIVVWKVINTAEALFEVDNYEDYVQLQSESALRNLVCHFPYDSSDDELSLRRSTDEISDRLKVEIDARLQKAGVEVLEARLSQLSYAPEIAAAMLQRQQAAAVVAARTKIVEGAVGMVELALDHLAEKKLVDLTAESRAQLVSNLLVVLCADRHVQPVVNTGPAKE